MRIRRATELDSNEIIDIINSTGIGTHHLVMNNYLDKRLIGQMWVYEIDNKVIAYASVIYNNYQAFVDCVSVDESYKRSGIGVRLLIGIIDILYDKGIRQLICGVYPENMISRGILNRTGFKTIGEQYVMYKQLEGGDSHGWWRRNSRRA